MEIKYKDHVVKYSDSFKRVTIDPNYVTRINNFVTDLVETIAKLSYQLDLVRFHPVNSTLHFCQVIKPSK